MKMFRRMSCWLFVLLLLLPAAVSAENKDALLVVAHGARTPGWNERVIRLVDGLDWPGPRGVAFLMNGPEENSLPRVAARLDAAGVERIIIVPLLVSSFSEHYEEVRYYSGQRKDVPAHAHGALLHTRAQLVLAGGMDDHTLITQILAEQIRALSTEAPKESVVLVAHGPNEDADNEKWLACLRTHGSRLEAQLGLKRVAVATLRDDAPKPVRDAATQALRKTVQDAGSDTRVIVVPVLISVGHIQVQIRERLAGTDYVMSGRGIADYLAAAEWVRQAALTAGSRNTGQTVAGDRSSPSVGHRH